MIDVHSHLLPGIDDGARDFGESIAILRGLQSQGITDLILTPHYIHESAYNSPRARNLELLQQFRNIAAKSHLSVNLYLGNEIYIDHKIPELLARHLISPAADSKYLLVELPMSGDFPDYEDVLLNLHHSGWHVLLAHPERYLSVQEDYQIVEELTDQGILLQCNLGSIIGQYGKFAQRTVKKIIKDNLVFCFGTDTHHMRDFSEITKAQRKLTRYYTNYQLQQLLVTNPRRIISRRMV